MTKNNKEEHNLYFFTNIEDGIMYIGKTSNGNFGNGTALKKAIKEQGRDKFIWGIFGKFPNHADLDFAERIMVTKETADNPRMYNKASGGGSSFSMSDATRKRMSESHKGKPSGMLGKNHSPESRNKISKNNAKNMIGRKHTPEAIQKMKDNHTRPCLGTKLSEERKRAISKRMSGKNNPMYGKKPPQEQIERMLETKRKNGTLYPTDETRKKIGEAQRGEKHHMWGKKHKPETIEKMRQTRRGRKPHPNNRRAVENASKQPCAVGDMVFESTKQAAEYFNKNRIIISNWKKNNKAKNLPKDYLFNKYMLEAI